MLAAAASVRAAGYGNMIVHNVCSLMACIDPLMKGVLLHELSVCVTSFQYLQVVLWLLWVDCHILTVWLIISVYMAGCSMPSSRLCMQLCTCRSCDDERVHTALAECKYLLSCNCLRAEVVQRLCCCGDLCVPGAVHTVQALMSVMWGHVSKYGFSHLVTTGMISIAQQGGCFVCCRR